MSVTVRVGAPPPPPTFRGCLEERRHAVGSVYHCNPPITVTIDDYDAFMKLDPPGRRGDRSSKMTPVRVTVRKGTGEVEHLELTSLPEWGQSVRDQRLLDLGSESRDDKKAARRKVIQAAKRNPTRPERKAGIHQGEPGARESLARMLVDRLDHLEYGPCPTVKCGLPDDPGAKLSKGGPFALGPHQQAAVELFATPGANRLLLAQRTGAGKTYIILGCVKRFLDDHPDSKKTINIVVPTSELVKNIYESMPTLFPDGKINESGFKTSGRQVHVGLYHHFARKDGVEWSHPKAMSREAYDRQQKRADELKLRTKEGKPYRVNVSKKSHRNIFEGAVTFFDEAHYLTEPQELVKQGNVGTAARVLLLAEMIREASDDARIVLLTATPATAVADLDNLMNIVVGDHGLSQGRSRDEGYVCFFPEDVGAPINFATGKWLVPGMQLPQILPVPAIQGEELSTFAEQYLCGVGGRRNGEDMVARAGLLGKGSKACWRQGGKAASQNHAQDKLDSLAVLENAGGVKTRARPQDFYRYRSTQDRRARVIVKAGNDLVPKMAAVADYVAGTKGKALVMAYTEHGGLALQKMLEEKGVTSRFLLGSSKKEEELGCHTAKGQGHNDCKAHAEVRDGMKLFNDPKVNRYGEQLRCLVLNPPNFQEGVSFCGVETIVLFDVPPDYKALVQRVGRAIRFCSHTSFAERVAVNVVMPVLHLPKAVSVDGGPEIDLSGVVTNDELAFGLLAEQWSENLRINCLLYGMAVDREYLSSKKRLPEIRVYDKRCSDSDAGPAADRTVAGPLVMDPPIDNRVPKMRSCKTALERDLAKIHTKGDRDDPGGESSAQRYLVTFEAPGLSREVLGTRVEALKKKPVKVATYWMGDLESYSAGLSRGSTFVVHMKRIDQAGLGDSLLRWIEKNVGGGILDAVRKTVGYPDVTLKSIEPVDAEDWRGGARGESKPKNKREREREQRAIDKYEECVYQVAGGDPPPDPEWIRKGARGKPPVRERGGHSIPEDAEPFNCPVDMHLSHRVAKQEWDEKAAESGWLGKLPPKPADPCDPICSDIVLRDAQRIKEDMALLTKECLGRGGSKDECDEHDLYAGYVKDRDRRCLPRPDDKKFVPEQSAECELHIKHRRLRGSAQDRQGVSGELDEIHTACVNVQNAGDAGERIQREHDRIAGRASKPAPASSGPTNLPVIEFPDPTETRNDRASRLSKSRQRCATGDPLCLVTGKATVDNAQNEGVVRVATKQKKKRVSQTPKKKEPKKRKRGTPSRKK